MLGLGMYLGMASNMHTWRGEGGPSLLFNYLIIKGQMRRRYRRINEAVSTAFNLVEGVAGKFQKALTGKDDRVVRQRRVGDDKVLLRRLQRLHQGVVGIVQNLHRSKKRNVGSIYNWFVFFFSWFSG